MQKMDRSKFKQTISSVEETYSIEGIEENLFWWYVVQKHKQLDDKSMDWSSEADNSVPCCMQGSYHRTDFACNIVYSGEIFQYILQS